MKENNDKSNILTTKGVNENYSKVEEEIAKTFVTSGMETKIGKSPLNEKELKIENPIEIGDSNSELKMQIADKEQIYLVKKSFN